MAAQRSRTRRVTSGRLLKPVQAALDAWFAELDRFADVPFMEDGRRQPPMPAPDALFGKTKRRPR